MEVLHVEVSRNPTSHLKTADVVKLLQEAIEHLENPVREFCIHDSKNAHLKSHVHSIKFCSASTTYRTVKATGKALDRAGGRDYGCNGYRSHSRIEYHIFKLNEEGENAEFVEDDDDDGQSPSSHHWILPSQAYHDLWDSLIFKSDIKTRLIDYIKTAMLYSEKMVNESLISWNKVILLHGPPGTGKTSLCKALAHKATIRLGARFDYGQLIEINSHSLFSKWFSESGKLVTRMFEKVQELIEDPHSIVFLLIDEVESLAQCRSSALHGNEPSDSIRAVNALLTQIDRIKKYPNVVILTTSNIVGSIDLAFVDRADMKIFIGNPPTDIIYEILASSINELLRVGIITSENNTFLPTTQRDVELHDPSYNAAQQLLKISKLAINMSGRTLRKLPFLTHVNFVGQEYCNLDYFLIAMERAIKAEKNDLETLDTKYFLRSQKTNDEADIPEIIGIFEPGTTASSSTCGRSRASRAQPSVGEQPLTSTTSNAVSSGRQIGRPRKTFVKPNTKNSSSKCYQESASTETPPKAKINKIIEEAPRTCEILNRKKALPVNDGPCPRSKKKGLNTPSTNVTSAEPPKFRSGSLNPENIKSEVVDGIRLRSTKVVHPLQYSDDSDEDDALEQRPCLEDDEPEVIPTVQSCKSSRLNGKPHALIRSCFVDLSKSICDPKVVKAMVQGQNINQSDSKIFQTNIVTTVAKVKAAEVQVPMDGEKKSHDAKDSVIVISDLPESTVAAPRPLPSISPRLLLPEMNANCSPALSNSLESRKSSKSLDPSRPIVDSVAKPSRPASTITTSTFVKAEPPDNNCGKKTSTPVTSIKPDKKTVTALKSTSKLESVDQDKGQQNIINSAATKTLASSDLSVKSASGKPNILSKSYVNKTVAPNCQPTVAITKIDPESCSNSSATSSCVNVSKLGSSASNSNSTLKSSTPLSTGSQASVPQQQQQQINKTVPSNLSKIVAGRTGESSDSSSKVVTNSNTSDSNISQNPLLPTPPLTPASTTTNEKHPNITPIFQNLPPKSHSEKVIDTLGFISNSTFRPSSTYNAPRISTSTLSVAENTSKNSNINNSNKIIRANSDNSNGSGHTNSAKRPRLSILSDRPPLDIIDLEENDSVAQNKSSSSNLASKGNLFSSGPSSIASSIASSPEPDMRFTNLSKQSPKGNSNNQSNKGKRSAFVCDLCDIRFRYKRELNSHNQMHAEVNRFLCKQCDKTFAKVDYLKKHMSRCKGLKYEPVPSPVNAKIQMDGNRLIFKTMSSSPVTPNSNNKVTVTSKIGNGNGTGKNSYYHNQSKTVSTGKAGGVGNYILDEEYSPASSYAPSPASYIKTGNLVSATNTVSVSLDASSNQKSGARFNCSDCKETFNTEKLLQRHSIIHQDERPFTCPICSKAFKTEKSLKFHDRLSHKEHFEKEHYACSICGLVFDSEEEVEEHEGKEHDPLVQIHPHNNNNNIRLMAPVPVGSTNNVTSLDVFPNDPQTPYSHAATELSSSVSSILSNSSDCDQLGGFYSGPGGGGCGTPYSETNTVESTALTISSMDTVHSDSHPFNSNFSNGNVLDSLDFPLGDDYRNCNICGECFLGEYELTQHKQIFHQNSLPGLLPEIPSDVVGCFMNETAIASVPVPDAETVIEVETTDEFLSFLDAF